MASLRISPALIEAALTMIVTLATGIAEALPNIIPSIVEAILLIVDTIINNLDMILEAAFNLQMRGLTPPSLDGISF